MEFDGEQGGVMADRPLSPERGQIMALLIYNGLTDFAELNGPISASPRSVPPAWAAA